MVQEQAPGLFDVFTSGVRNCELNHTNRGELHQSCLVVFGIDSHYALPISIGVRMTLRCPVRARAQLWEDLCIESVTVSTERFVGKRSAHRCLRLDSTQPNNLLITKDRDITEAKSQSTLVWERVELGVR